MIKLRTEQTIDTEIAMIAPLESDPLEDELRVVSVVPEQVEDCQY